MNKKWIYAALVQIAIIVASLQTKVYAQDDSWRDKMSLIRYAPRYFGPNAFPIPELRNGYIETRPEIEARGEYHVCKGDQTKDLFARFFVPVANGQAGLEVSYVIYEYYKMTQEMVDERNAAGISWPDGAHGDVVVSSFYKLLQSDKWADISVEATIKTASGNRLVDARYTDAASYWFLVNAGRNLYANEATKTRLRLQGLIGFYCWMTNDIVHRQNDAPVYAVGVGGSCGRISVDANIAGLYGYKNNGDRPLQLRIKLNCEMGKNILSCRFRYGLKDCLYDSYSIAYIRSF